MSSTLLQGKGIILLLTKMLQVYYNNSFYLGSFEKTSNSLYLVESAVEYSFVYKLRLTTRRKGQYKAELILSPCLPRHSVDNYDNNHSESKFA